MVYLGLAVLWALEMDQRSRVARKTRQRVGFLMREWGLGGDVYSTSTQFLFWPSLLQLCILRFTVLMGLFGKESFY